MKVVELVAASDNLDTTDATESDFESHLTLQFSDNEPVEEENLLICDQCNKVLKTRQGLNVHIDKVHKRKKPKSLQIGHPYKTGNRPQDFTMKASKYEPFECITVTRYIPTKLEAKLRTDQKPLCCTVRDAGNFQYKLFFAQIDLLFPLLR